MVLINSLRHFHRHRTITASWIPWKPSCLVSSARMLVTLTTLNFSFSASFRYIIENQSELREFAGGKNFVALKIAIIDCNIKSSLWNGVSAFEWRLINARQKTDNATFNSKHTDTNHCRLMFALWTKNSIECFMFGFFLYLHFSLSVDDPNFVRILQKRIKLKKSISIFHNFNRSHSKVRFLIRYLIFVKTKSYMKKRKLRSHIFSAHHYFHYI